MPVILSEEDSVGVKEIDDQHKHFISILNKLYSVVNEAKPREMANKIVDELVEYAASHFSTEEKYFDQFHYELADEHKTEHQKITTKLLEFQKSYQKKESDITADLVDFLEDWLVDHLGTQDKKYTECFHKNGLY